MRGLKVPYGHAEEAKHYLIERELFDKRYHTVNEADAVIFPVVREFGPPFAFDVEFVEMDAEERTIRTSLKETLEPLLTKKELQHLRTAFDTVGSIAIIEIMPELEEKQLLIAEKLLEINKNVTTVLKKAGGRSGTYRTQPLTFLAGEDTRIAKVIENGVKLKVNVEEAYYSIRMSTERKRILDMVRPGEHILCMFSGVGPYPVTLSVHSQAEKIIGIEINPAGHELAMENIGRCRKRNKTSYSGHGKRLIDFQKLAPY